MGVNIIRLGLSLCLPYSALRLLGAHLQEKEDTDYAKLGAAIQDSAACAAISIACLYTLQNSARNAYELSDYRFMVTTILGAALAYAFWDPSSKSADIKASQETKTLCNTAVTILFGAAIGSLVDIKNFNAPF